MQPVTASDCYAGAKTGFIEREFDMFPSFKSNAWRKQKQHNTPLMQFNRLLQSYAEAGELAVLRSDGIVNMTCMSCICA